LAVSVYPLAATKSSSAGHVTDRRAAVRDGPGSRCAGNFAPAARTWTGTKRSPTPSPKPPKPSTNLNPPASHERATASRCGYRLQERLVARASDHVGQGLGLTRRIRWAESWRFPVSRRSGSAPNWMFCDAEPGELGIHGAAHTRHRYMGDRRSPSRSGHITLDIRVIIAPLFESDVRRRSPVYHSLGIGCWIWGDPPGPRGGL
jgi:hypothetical protein